MAQYWLQVSQESDTQFFVPQNAADEVTFETVNDLPVVRCRSTVLSLGRFFRFTPVPAVAAAHVAIYGFVLSSAASTRASGPAARINGTNVGVATVRTSDTETLRLQGSDGSALNFISSTANTPLMGTVPAWWELSVNEGISCEGRLYDAPENRPTGPTRSGDWSTLSSYPTGFVGVGRAGQPPSGESNVYVHIIAVGTDGDPAPTGPVGPSERQRSRLILTPW